MKLWHDDVRPAPAGWVWVQNNDDAKAILSACSEIITEMSMDHDLGGVPYTEAGTRLKGASDDTGYQLAYWMIFESLENNIVLPEKIVIHSWNPPGARNMISLFNQIGHKHVAYQPFDPKALGIGPHYVT